MRTKDIVRAKLKARLPDEAVPPFTAVETLIMEAIDEMKNASNSKIYAHEMERLNTSILGKATA
jgi:hypothetical protein